MCTLMLRDIFDILWHIIKIKQHLNIIKQYDNFPSIWKQRLRALGLGSTFAKLYALLEKI